MAKIVYGLNQSLDGYVDHQVLPVPGPKLFRHFIELAQQVAGSVYGSTRYGFMRYWDDDQPEWTADERDYAAAWRSNQSVTDLGLIDEYRIYLHPVVLGEGKPYFRGPTPPLRLAASDQLDENVIRLTYVPA